MHKYYTYILDNGLKIVGYNIPQANSVALGVWVKTGGRYENMKNKGISHFVEHVLFKGTEKRTAAQIKNSIEGIGGMLNGFTSDELTCYLAKVLGKHIYLALDVLSDMVLNARFALSDIERERYVILEEIKMYKDHPDQYVHELLGELLWPNQPLGVPLIGTLETIKSLSKNDLVRYRDESYNPSNITVAVCGKINWDEFVNRCVSIFKRKKSKKVFEYDKMKVSQAAARSNVFSKGTEQTHIAIGFHSLGRNDERRYAMDLLNIILGGNMSSRLFHELREKRGLAYAISSHTRYYKDGGLASVEAGVDNSKTIEAIELIFKELKKITKEHVTKKEFNRAKEYYHGHLAFMVESTTEHMLWLGEKIVTHDMPLNIETVIEKIEKVRIEDVLKIARDTFTRKNLNLAIVGPAKDKEKDKIARLAGGF